MRFYTLKADKTRTNCTILGQVFDDPALCPAQVNSQRVMRLPNFQNAVIRVNKFEDYVLNPEHREGKHKARIFREWLGIERHHAEVLAELIRSGLKRAPAKQRESNEHGDLWTTWHEIVGLNNQSAIVTVAWMFKTNVPEIPVLISCYIETGEQDKLRGNLYSE